MVVRIIIPTVFLLVNLAANCQTKFPLFLEGTWQVDEKNTFETWKKISGNHLKGYSFVMKDSTKIITESLEIYVQNDNLYYAATVPDQNDGKTIVFKLVPGSLTSYSFENPEHDFPNKIIYTNISEGKLTVEVLGNSGAGFTLKMTRLSINSPN
ncbi:MAG TPA: DUF6265 family protein [Saprospiraceae bacterium]|nr:hypothetical protein [Saprospiraceae bacterium]HPG07246.1 DUF6265 family protein [Saprospiraceae bacterium]HRV83784.1 DUF6265 family protein [Saprospiraceae bacterium]